MCQGNEDTPALTIKDYTLEAISQFTYLGSTTSNNAPLDVELGKRIGTCKAATNMAKLSDRVWENKKLTTQTKVAVYRACIMSTLLYSSQFWTTYTGQEKHLNIFHMRFLRYILSIEWMDKVSNNKVQSNLSNTDTEGTEQSVRIREVSVLERSRDYVTFKTALTV